MANLIKWGTPETITTLHTTTLDGLTTNTLSAAGTAYDNGTTKATFAAFEVYLASLTPAAGGYVALYLAPRPDGSNYADVKREYAHQLIGTLALDTAAATKRIVLPGVQIPPTAFYVYLDNQAGVTLASSGNTVKILPYNYELQ